MSFIFHTGVKSDEYTTIAVLEYSETSEFYCWSVGWFWFCCMNFGILVPQPGAEPGPLAVRAQSPNHWISRELALPMVFYVANYHPSVSTLRSPFSISCEANLMMINLLSFCLSVRYFISPLSLSFILYLCPLSMKDSIDGQIFWSVGCLFVSALWIIYACLLSHFTVTLWTIACQCPLFIGFSQTRILEWVAMPSSRGSSQPRRQTCISCDSSIAGGFFATEPEYTRKHISIVSWPTRFLLKNLRVL